MSKTKASGSTKYGRDSNPKYLGVKLFDGQLSKIGSIIIRQRGSKFLPGANVKRGKDDTLYALKAGIIKFKTINKKCYDGSRRLVKVVNVIADTIIIGE